MKEEEEKGTEDRGEEVEEEGKWKRGTGGREGERRQKKWVGGGGGDGNGR